MVTHLAVFCCCWIHSIRHIPYSSHHAVAQTQIFRRIPISLRGCTQQVTKGGERWRELRTGKKSKYTKEWIQKEIGYHNDNSFYYWIFLTLFKDRCLCLDGTSFVAATGLGWRKYCIHRQASQCPLRGCNKGQPGCGPWGNDHSIRGICSYFVLLINNFELFYKIDSLNPEQRNRKRCHWYRGEGRWGTFFKRTFCLASIIPFF